MLEIVPIFEDPNCKLFAVKYDDEDVVDAFEQLFDNWQDAEYLFNFFEENIADLQADFYNYTINEAVQLTIAEATDFITLIMETTEDGKVSDTGRIYELFLPLSPSEFRLAYLQKQKAKNPEIKNSWLRIYGIKLDDGFVITGGAIKLTERMDQQEHTKLELNKLEIVKQFLKVEGIMDVEGLMNK